MKRRDVLRSIAGLTAAVKAPDRLFSQQAKRSAEQPPEKPAAGDDSEPAALPLSFGDQAGEPVPQFFSREEMAAFKRLAEVLVPRTRTPGALEAEAPEFLDFYLAQSEPDRQSLYRKGIRRLHAEAQRRFGRPFAELGYSDMDKLLAPLREPWTAAPSPDPAAAFLRAAKEDLFRATTNSRAWAAAVEGRERSTGATYWYPVE
jgi:hypothetical protein